MISLWVVTMLAFCAIGLGHRASIAVRLADYQKERLRAYCVAKAGLACAILELIKDRDANAYDTLHESWSTGYSLQTSQPLFDHQPVPEGGTDTFTVRYLFDRQGTQYFCMADEERKININKIDSLHQQQLGGLLVSLGFDPARAKEFLDTVADWIDADTKTASGTDEDVSCKNAPLATLEELRAIFELFYARHNESQPKEKARQMYERIAGFVTIYTDGKININTASASVLKCVIDGLLTVNSVPSVVEGDAGGIVNRIIVFRQAGGSFDQEDVADIENRLSSQGTELTTGQQNIVSQLLSNGLVTVRSSFFSIEVDSATAKKIHRHITAIVNRVDVPQLVYWHES